MANAITRTILENGPRNAVVLFTVVGDGSGDESTALVFDYSAITPAPGTYYVKFVQGSTAGCSGLLSFDATTDAPFLSLGADMWTKYKGDFYAGIPYSKVAGAGATGDIVLATQGLGTGNSCTIVVGIVKGNT